MVDSDARFWNEVEKIETDYVSDCDRKRFRRRMKAKGFDPATIAERETAIDGNHAAFRGAPPPL